MQNDFNTQLERQERGLLLYADKEKLIQLLNSQQSNTDDRVKQLTQNAHLFDRSNGNSTANVQNNSDTTKSAILVKNDYLYRFNFAPTWESHEDNIKTGGDGFEIVSKEHTSKITKEEINKIKIKYGSRYPNSINRLLESYASENRRRRNRNKFTQDRKPDGRDALLDKGQSREETQQDRDNQSSHSHRGRDNRLDSGIADIMPDVDNLIC